MSSHILLSEHILQQAAAEDWEEMPGMQSIIRRAEALGPQDTFVVTRNCCLNPTPTTGSKGVE